MKNKKFILYLFIIGIIALIVLGIITVSSFNTSNNSTANEITEYTPAQEFSDDEIRKTITSLYFKNIETNSLIAEAKCIDVKELYSDPYTCLINLLITGPESEKLESAIPEGTKVNSCVLKGDTVYVDLSREFINNAPTGIQEESMIIYSIVNTLTELNEVNNVKFLINGEENCSFKDNAISFKDAFAKND